MACAFYYSLFAIDHFECPLVLNAAYLIKSFEGLCL
jgi:hypothetical protein